MDSFRVTTVNGRYALPEFVVKRSNKIICQVFASSNGERKEVLRSLDANRTLIHIERDDRAIMVKETNSFFGKRYYEIIIGKIVEFIWPEADGTPIYNGEMNSIYEHEYTTHIPAIPRSSTVIPIYNVHLSLYTLPICMATGAIIRMKHGITVPSPIYGYIPERRDVQESISPKNTIQPLIIKQVVHNRWNALEL